MTSIWSKIVQVHSSMWLMKSLRLPWINYRLRHVIRVWNFLVIGVEISLNLIIWNCQQIIATFTLFESANSQTPTLVHTLLKSTRLFEERIIHNGFFFVFLISHNKNQRSWPIPESQLTSHVIEYKGIRKEKRKIK
jgi:hypothetical protein